MQQYPESGLVGSSSINQSQRQTSKKTAAQTGSFPCVLYALAMRALILILLEESSIWGLHKSGGMNSKSRMHHRNGNAGMIKLKGRRSAAC